MTAGSNCMCDTKLYRGFVGTMSAMLEDERAPDASCALRFRSIIAKREKEYISFKGSVLQYSVVIVSLD